MCNFNDAVFFGPQGAQNPYICSKTEHAPCNYPDIHAYVLIIPPI